MASIAKNIVERSIVEEMETSYIDYSMSVIVGRALPDVRDGLKPVQRRILYGLRELGMTSGKPHKKSARLVGEVLGKYHPHGDVALYDTMVRMAQDFNYRYPLVDGQGNFGSIDGDTAAAMRYTEARMTPLAEQMLVDLDQETVDTQPNFDDTLDEPVVLPAGVPNLLVNGSNGIAVGMSTSIPSHNLGEVVDGLVALIDNPDLDTQGLMQYIPGPDFATGGVITADGDLQEAYETGRGTVTVRGKVMVEDQGYGKRNLVITEIPYQVNKTTLLERIVRAGERGHLEEVTSINDESDRHGLRIVLELKRGSDPAAVLETLYSRTPLASSFSIILLALVDGQPQQLSLKQLGQYYLDHRLEVVQRRTRYRLAGAQRRAHVLEGLIKAVDIIDQVIALIRSSDDRSQAHRRLVDELAFTDRQAKAILELRLHRLTGLEIEQLQGELDELEADIERYQEILASDQSVMQVVREELLALKEQFDDQRRTALTSDDGLVMENSVPDENVAIAVTRRGFIKYVTLTTFRRNVRAEKDGYAFGDDDFLACVERASLREYLLIFTRQGQVIDLPVADLEKAQWRQQGQHLGELVDWQEGDQVAAVLPVSSEANGALQVLQVTRGGIVKKSLLEEYVPGSGRGSRQAINLEESDEVTSVVTASAGEDELLVATRDGRLIRFANDEVNAYGRTAKGVKAIDLEQGDTVLWAGRVAAGDVDAAQLVTVSTAGFFKKSPLQEYRKQSRAGKGQAVALLDEETGQLAGAGLVTGDEYIAIIHSSDPQVVSAGDITSGQRRTRGTRLIASEQDVQGLMVLY